MGLTFLLSQLSEGGGGPVHLIHTHYTTGTGMRITAIPGAPRVASASPSFPFCILQLILKRVLISLKLNSAYFVEFNKYLLQIGLC